MSDALDTALKKARKLAPDRQEELAELIEDYVDIASRRQMPLTAEERELVLQGLADFKDGRVASPEEVEAAYKVHRAP